MPSLSFARKSWTRRASIDLWLKAERHAEADIFDAVVEFLKEQRRDVAAEVRKLYEKHPEWTEDRDAADRIVDNVYDAREWDEDLRNAVGPAIARTVIRGYLSTRAVQAGRRRRFPPVWRKGGSGSGNFGHAESSLAKIGRIATKQDWADSPLTDQELREVLEFDLPPNVTRRVYKVVGQVMDKPYWKDVNDVERERMRWSLQDGIQEGKTLRQIAKDIQRDIASDEVRARRITVTETTNALSAGHIIEGEEAEDLGIKIAKVWVTLGDDKVRSSHEDADGQVVEGSQGMFTVGGYQCIRPGDPDLPAEERCNCRCYPQIEPLFEAEKSSWVRRNGVWIDRDYAELARRERVERLFAVKGGPGSGNFGHEGRPGEVGGSAPSDGSGTTEAGSSIPSAPSAKPISAPPAKPAEKPRVESQPTAISSAGSNRTLPAFSLGAKSIPGAVKNNGDQIKQTISKSPQVKKAVEEYTINSHKGINNHLRRGWPIGTNESKMIPHLDAVTNATFGSPVTVYRGISSGKDEQSVLDAAKQALKTPGMGITDKGFTSTSLHPGIAANFGGKVLLQITTRKGAYLEPVTGASDEEHEVLLPRGKPYRVHGIDKNVRLNPKSKDRYTVIRLELVG